MKIKLVAFLFFAYLLFLCFLWSASAESDKYNFLRSTAILQIASEGDSSDNSCTVEEGFCTAVAFAKNGQKYKFFTAAHCVADYKKEIRKTVLTKSFLQLVLEKQNGDKFVYPTKVVALGEMKNFEDFAILEAEVDEDTPIMQLSEYRPELDEEVRIATVPAGLDDVGLLQLRGYISKEKVRHVMMKSIDVNAAGAFIVQVNGLGQSFGSSGGGVASFKNNDILGIVTGATINQLGHISLIVTPITEFNRFYEEYAEGKRPLAKKEIIEPKQGENKNSCVNPISCDLPKE